MVDERASGASGNAVRRAAMRLLPLAGLCILAYLILRTGPETILNTFMRTNPAFLIPAVLLFFVYFCLQNFKWEYIMKRQGIRAGYWRLFRIYLIGTFYGLVTPGRIGNLVRIRYVKELTGRSTGESSVSVILDKALDFAALALLAVFGIAALANHISFEIYAVVLALFAAFFCALLMIFRRSTSVRVLRIFWRLFVPARLKAGARDAFDAFYRNIVKWRQTLIPFAVTLAGWIILYSTTYVVGLSVGVEAPFTAFIMILPVATLVSLIPVTVGGFGTRETVMVLLFSAFGVAPELVIVMSLISAVLSYIVTAAFGGLFAFLE